jgi:hypothetical protein
MFQSSEWSSIFLLRQVVAICFLILLWTVWLINLIKYIWLLEKIHASMVEMIFVAFEMHDEMSSSSLWYSGRQIDSMLWHYNNQPII